MTNKQKKLSITLIRSAIGRLPKHRATVLGLGLKKLNQKVIVEDTPSIRGMINQINYLLLVEEI